MTEEDLLAAEQLEAAAIAAAESGEFGRAAALYRQTVETYPGLPGEAQRDFGWNLGVMYRATGDDEQAVAVFEHYGFDPTPGTGKDDGGIEFPIDPQTAGEFSLLRWTEAHGRAAAVRSLELHRERVRLLGDNVDKDLNGFLDRPSDDVENGSRLASALTAFHQANRELWVAIDGCVSALDGDQRTAIDDAFGRVVDAYGHRDSGLVGATAHLRETVDTDLAGIVDGNVLFPAAGVEASLRKGIIGKLRHPDKIEFAADTPSIGDQLRVFGRVIDLGKKLLHDHRKDIDALKQVLQRSHEHNRVDFESMGDFSVDDYDPQTGDYLVTLSTGARGRLVKQQHHRFVAEHGASQQLDEGQKHRMRLAIAWLGKNWPDRLGEPPRDSASDISWNLDGAAFVRTLPAARPSQQPHLYDNVRLKAVPDYQRIAHNPDLLWKQPCFGSFTLSLIVHPDGSCSAPTEGLGEAHLLETDGLRHGFVHIENLDALVAEQRATRGWANVARGHFEYHYAYNEMVAARNWTLINDGRYTVDAIYREHWERYNDHLDTPFDTWMALDHVTRPSLVTKHHGQHKHHGPEEHSEHHHEHHHERHRGHRGRPGHDRHQSHSGHQEHHENGQFHYGYQFAFADYATQEELYDREYGGVDGTTFWQFIKALRTMIDEMKGEVVERAHALVLVQLHQDAWYASVYADETESRPVVQYRAGTTNPSQLSKVEEAVVITTEESDSD